MIAIISKFLFEEWYNCCLLHSVLHGCVINPCWLSCMFRCCTNYMLKYCWWTEEILWRCSTFILPGSVLVTTQASCLLIVTLPLLRTVREKNLQATRKESKQQQSLFLTLQEKEVIPDFIGETAWPARRSYSGGLPLLPRHWFSFQPY